MVRMQWWWLVIAMAIWIAPDKLLIITAVEGSVPNYSLPPGWTAHVHEGRPYESGISQWEEPLLVDEDKKEEIQAANLMQQQQQQSESHQHMLNYPQNHVSSSVHGGTSWEEKALLGAGWGSGAHTQGEGEELVDSDIRGSTLAEKISCLQDENGALRNELDRECALVDDSASNLTSVVGELVQAVTDRRLLVAQCAALQHELVNVTTTANKLSRHLDLSKLSRAKLSENVMQKNKKIKELEEHIKELIEDMGTLDKTLGQYMGDREPDGNSMSDVLSWSRIKKTLLDPLVPESIRGPTADELEIQSLRSEIKKSHKNTTALADALASKSDLISELNARISRFKEDGAKRRSTVAKLKSSIDSLTLEVEEKKMEISDLLLARQLFSGGWAAALSRESDALSLLQATECATLSIQEELNAIMEDKRLKEEEKRRVIREKEALMALAEASNTSATDPNTGYTDTCMRNERACILPLTVNSEVSTRGMSRTAGCCARDVLIGAWR